MLSHRELQTSDNVQQAQDELNNAAEAKKCWSCGCFHDAVRSIEKAIPSNEKFLSLGPVVEKSKPRFGDRKYECLGCKVCWPALALNALGNEDASFEMDNCPSQDVERQDGWPPLPGDYTVLKYQAPVAICILNSGHLKEHLEATTHPGISIIGSLQTENLGIERIISNVIANPYIRFVILCGDDSEKAIGHLPGQSFLSLASNGINERKRIVDAKGKRPVLKNITDAEINHFRKEVEVVDLIGVNDVDKIITAVESCAEENPGPGFSCFSERTVTELQGSIPDRVIPDPQGYYVIFLDRENKKLQMEHYSNKGSLLHYTEGKQAAELYLAVINEGIVSRLDHAAYLGKELARAEAALISGANFIQDAAPQRFKKRNTKCKSC